MNGSLVFDARWLKTGIGRYTLAVLDGLRNYLRDVEVLCITQPKYVDLISALCDRVIVSSLDIYTFQEQLVLPWIAQTGSAFYAPHYNIPVFWNKRLLVTIHDLNHLLDATYRRTWKSRLYARPLLKLAVEKADCIVVPSDYTRRMLQQHLQVAPTRVTVIPGAVSASFQVQNKALSRAKVAHDHGIAQPYILFVGNLGPNKNVPVLLEALGRLNNMRRDAPRLVIVAGSKGKQEMQTYANTLGLKDAVIWLENLSDSSLATVYSAAIMTIMPSLEEGFGMPIVESMACGTPVICSKAASLPEVAGDAALLFSPHSSEELTAAMEKLLDSTGDQERLIDAGLRRAKMYSRQASAVLQAAVIRKLLAA